MVLQSADYLVTTDPHLLQAKELSVLTPGQFMRQIKYLAASCEAARVSYPEIPIPEREIGRAHV